MDARYRWRVPAEPTPAFTRVGQVAAFSIENPIPADNLRRAVNRLLPRDIRVLQAEEVALDFHPRFQTRAQDL